MTFSDHVSYLTTSRKTNHMRIFLCLSLFIVLSADAATTINRFGTGNESFEIEFVRIGNPRNGPDDTGYGAVDYVYQIGRYEVSGGMIDSYNALSGGPPITRAGELFGYTASMPAVDVSWNEAARFVNWLNVQSGYSPAYRFGSSGGNDHVAFWSSTDAGFDPANPLRNSNAYYFLPTENEWYKAAYFDPSVSAYWDYPTGSDEAPIPIISGTSPNTAVYLQAFAVLPADITEAGGLSPYGTMAQGGNLHEWMESFVQEPAGSTGDLRVVRGGDWGSVSEFLLPTSRSTASPELSSFIGFRVAAIPEPSFANLVLAALLSLMWRRARR